MPERQRSEADRRLHANLVQELVDLFVHEGFLVSGAVDCSGYVPPPDLPNDGYGDQEDKAPDVYAYDPVRKVYVLGEAKTGQGDFETEHALTQYNVFLDQTNRVSGKPTYAYFIVPASHIAAFQSLISHYIHRDYWHRIVYVSATEPTA